MNAPQDKAKSIFLNALEIPSAVERQAYLDAECGSDQALRREVEEFLQHHGRIGCFLESPAANLASPPGGRGAGGEGVGPTVDDPITERPGTVIGPYKLLEQIGEGGFGVVFMAEQTQPVRRKVALKVIKPGMDTRQVIARFEAERQALALMDHPNIAKVLDAGSTGISNQGSGISNQGSGIREKGDAASGLITDPCSLIPAEGRASGLITDHCSLIPAEGRPYFVMELVKGVPITDYCDQNQLTPRERLELFIPVCHAVQHAHQKGIIHRDIKPSNVMVTLHDGTPVPKIIDFGIAKAMGQQLTDKTLFTNFAQMIGTPLYMSPEQAALSGLDVDTRSDIYSLGVLLYELLTGTTPFDKERFQEAGYDEIRRIIREEEPPKPSKRLSDTWKAERTAQSAERNAQSAGRTAGVKGASRSALRALRFQELDWIVMKCLEKDRNRRYESASALAADVHRYLHDEPVQAYPPSVWYRFRKFIRRHRGALTAAGLVLFFLVAVGTGAGWMVRDRTALRALTNERGASALEDAAALQSQGKWQEALEAVKRAEGILAGGGSNDLRAEGRERRKDLEMVLRLEQIRFQAHGRGQEGDREAAVRDASFVRAFQGFDIDVDALEPDEAAARVRARTIFLQLAAALDGWADDRRSCRKPEDAWKRLFAVARAADPDAWRNQVRDALERGDRETLGQLATSANVRELPMQSLSLLVYRGHLDPVLEQSLLRQAQREHPEDFGINFQIGWAADLEDQIRFYTAAVVARPKHAFTRFYLARALWSRGKWDEAIATYQKAVELNPEFALAYNNLAWSLATCPEPKLCNPSWAIELAKKAVDLDTKQASYWNTLGLVHYRTGDWNKAIISLKKAEELAPGKYFAWNVLFLAMAHWQLSEKELARQEFEQAVRWMEKNQPKNPELQRFRAEAEELMRKESGVKSQEEKKNQ